MSLSLSAVTILTRSRLISACWESQLCPSSGPPLPPQHNKGISSPFSWGCVLPRIELVSWATLGFPCGSAGKESSCNAGYLGSIPELGRSPGEGKGYPLQYSGLENYRNCMIHGVTKSRTQLSDFHSLTYLGHLLQSCLRD